MAKDKQEWRKVEETIMRWDKVGDEVIGLLLERNRNSVYGNEVYRIETDTGEVWTVFGTTVLESKMSAVDEGDEIKIVYMGEKANEKKGQQPIKLFEVFVKQE